MSQQIAFAYLHPHLLWLPHSNLIYAHILIGGDSAGHKSWVIGNCLYEIKQCLLPKYNSMNSIDILDAKYNKQCCVILLDYNSSRKITKTGKSVLPGCMVELAAEIAEIVAAAAVESASIASTAACLFG